jgi:tetratricopeptide (TPR) repeat protein
MRYTLAQVLIQDEQYQAGVAALESWLAQEKTPSLDARQLAAIAYTRLGKCGKAIPHLKAIVAAPRAEESWSQALLACHVELQQYEAAGALLETLLRRSPQNKDYWMQAVALRQTLKQDAQALALMALAHERGLLTPSEVMNLARMYLSADAPLRAARLLAKELEQGRLPRQQAELELLAESWRLAREYDAALEAYQELSRIRPTADLYLRIGQLEVERERWQEAQAALRKAVEGAGPADAGFAWLLLGIASSHANDPALAQRSLNEALGYESSRELARVWLKKLAADEAAEPAAPAAGDGKQEAVDATTEG